MKIPEEVQERIDFLETGYTEVHSPIEADIIHIYPSEVLCYPNGLYDSRWFNIVFFNTEERVRYRSTRKHDQVISAWGTAIREFRVFADGSFLIKFHSLKSFEFGQDISILD